MALLPGALENAAKAARSCGRPTAVRDLADLVETFGRAPLMHTIKTQTQKNTGFGGAQPAMARDINT
jgi:UDP-N-acetylglucosamine--N-acetylmuramyl-(pentapeptide) pyrophosphoryl-undecaprenol N-acetylglucosamine transferase